MKVTVRFEIRGGSWELPLPRAADTDILPGAALSVQRPVA